MMEIKLGEDNGFLFGGVPSLIVVTVLFDNGRQVRFPYQADKAISALYEDLSRVNSEEVKASPALVLDPENQPPMKMVFTPDVSRETIDPNKIEKGDIVKCVFLENRNDHMGSPATIDLSVGGLYRVVKVLANGYSVLDDNAALKLPMTLFNHEVQLHEKHKPYTKKQTFFEEAVNCPKCNEVTYCGLHGGFYTGKCDCGQEIKISREEVKGGQGGNRNTQKVEAGSVGGALQEAI